MIILGLDPGYDRCGFAVIERGGDGKEILIESTCVVTDRKEPFEKRLVQIAKEFRVYINKYKPDVCVLETLFFASNQKTAMRVAEARGALIIIVSELGIPIKEFTPKQVKIAVTGDGGATKQQVMMMLPKLLLIDKEVKYDDEFDAIAVGLTASATFRSMMGVDDYPHT